MGNRTENHLSIEFLFLDVVDHNESAGCVEKRALARFDNLSTQSLIHRIDGIQKIRIQSFINSFLFVKYQYYRLNLLNVSVFFKH